MELDMSEKNRTEKEFEEEIPEDEESPIEEVRYVELYRYLI